MPALEALGDHVSYDFTLVWDWNCCRKSQQDKTIGEGLVSYDFNAPFAQLHSGS